MERNDEELWLVEFLSQCMSYLVLLQWVLWVILKVVLISRSLLSLCYGCAVDLLRTCMQMAQ